MSNEKTKTKQNKKGLKVVRRLSIIIQSTSTHSSFIAHEEFQFKFPHPIKSNIQQRKQTNKKTIILN